MRAILRAPERGDWEIFVVHEWSASLDDATHARVVRALVDTIPGFVLANFQEVARAGGEEAVQAGNEELLNEIVGHRLAELRRARGMTQQQIAERMGVTKGRISQIEQGQISGQDVLARFAAALGGRLHQAIYFDNGDIAAVA